MGNYCCKYKVVEEQKSEIHSEINVSAYASSVQPLTMDINENMSGNQALTEEDESKKGEEDKGKESEFSEHGTSSEGESESMNFKKVKCVHLIMAVDSSNSMKGRRWRKLLKAYRRILFELSRGYGNKVSVINLGQNKAKLVQKELEAKGTTKTKLEFLGGGTKFEPGIRMINELIKSTSKRMGVIIFFFSDGEDRIPRREMEEMNKLKKQFKQFRFYAIGVEATVSMLKQMAKMVEGEFVKVVNADQFTAELTKLLFDTYTRFTSDLYE